MKARSSRSKSKERLMRKYSLFFAEDEETLREKIRDTIDWESTDFEYIGEAGDGETALLKILDLQPDIVITDIKMPRMSGLELIRSIRNENLETVILIISGHDDFAFAQEAIRLDVQEYLLKPVTPMNLMKALNRAAITLNKKHEKQVQYSVLQSEAKESMDLRRNRFLQRLMTGINPADAFEEAASLDADIRAGCYCVAVAKGKTSVDFSELQENVRRIEPDAYVFPIGYREAGILTMGKNISLRQEKNEILSEGLKRSPLFIGSAIRLYFGDIVGSVSDIRTSFLAACTGSDVDNQEIWNEFEKMRHYEGIDVQQLTNFLYTGSVSDTSDFLNSWLHLHGNDKSIVPYSLYIISTVSFVVRDFIDELGCNSVEISLRPDLNFRSLQAIQNECKELIEYAITLRNRQSDKKYEDIISAVCSKIQSDYADQDISLITLAKYANVSPSYLSTIFKRSLGVTLQSYLINIRMEEAKKLLRTTDMRISEISGSVGYPNPNYFNVVFKRTVGINPLQYRKEK